MKSRFLTGLWFAMTAIVFFLAIALVAELVFRMVSLWSVTVSGWLGDSLYFFQQLLHFDGLIYWVLGIFVCGFLSGFFLKNWLINRKNLNKSTWFSGFVFGLFFLIGVNLIFFLLILLLNLVGSNGHFSFNGLGELFLFILVLSGSLAGLPIFLGSVLSVACFNRWIAIRLK